MAETNQTNHDDCQNCKRQKAENEKFIAVYQRMQNLRKNVQKTVCVVDEHKKQMNGIRTLSKSLDFGIKKALKNQSQAENKTISTIGYQIAACLVQKSARNKIEQDNEYLRRRIETIRKKKQQQCALNQQHPCTLPRISQSYNKQNQLIVPNQSPYLNEHLNNRASQDNDNDTCSTKFSFFKNTKTRKLNASIYRQKYRNMNLWLYQHQNLNETRVAIQNSKGFKLKKI